MSALFESQRRTVERFNRREQRKTERGATYIAHAEGRAICEFLLPALAEFMVSAAAPRPPAFLRLGVHRLAPEELALAALSPLMHAIAVGRASAMQVKLSMGRALYDKMRRRRSEAGCVRVGNWMLACVLAGLEDVFTLDADGCPCVTKAGEEYALRLFAELAYRDPVFLPSTSPLRDWTGWRSGGYWDNSTRISAPFVRDFHPATEKAVRRAFRRGTMQEHVAGVNSLQRVPWAINAAMLPVVEQFAGIVGKKVGKFLVAQDLATANALSGKGFYVPMNCDFRGRVYGVPHFNFQREDHVRSLFLFADGAPITRDGLDWLMIHTASCGDFDAISKRPWRERIAWVENNRLQIMRTARNPAATVEWWRDADAPFSFVAACIELDAAWRVGQRFVSRLPVCFDGSCSGVQHLAAMMRDEDAGKFVNLIPSDAPQDVYRMIADRVKERVQAELGDWTQRLYRDGEPIRPRAEYARFWHNRLDRKIVKRPAMTYGYSVTLEGMRDQIMEAYSDLHDPTDASTFGASWYLAKHVMAACKEVLKRPAAAMEFIRGLAKHCADKGKAVEWTSPTGFPWANRYQRSNVKTVHLELRGEYVRHRVADGFKPGILKGKSMNAAAPNVVHAMDASHLIRVVNAAASEGIDLACVHDSFGCLAPRARTLHRIIREQFAELYDQDILADLREAAGSSEPIPAKGALDPKSVLKSEYAFN